MTADELLKPPSEDDYPVLDRQPSSYNPLHSFRLKGENKQYQQQYGDMYFLRLARLKPAVEAIAEDAWGEFQIAGEHARRVERVLDVRQGELCWVAGTVYMDMPLKPNILEDISHDHWISGPPPHHSYLSPDAPASTMLEDESGRLRLTGVQLQSTILVTGCIIAALGTENSNGDFEVIDIKVPDLPRQPQRWERDDIAASSKGSRAPPVRKPGDTPNKIAFISGLGVTGIHADALPLSLLTEYILGESGSTEDSETSSHISRLIIAGNSILTDTAPLDAKASETISTKKAGAKKYGYDASAYNPAPTAHLDAFLAELLPSIPITMMAGETDPANSSIPQQGVHQAMFPHARAYVTSNPATGEVDGGGASWFDSVTNPWEGDVEGWRCMGNSGQPVDDILRYLDLGSVDEGEGRLEVMESMLRWRCGAPTAPDTLWCYPFQDNDPFVIEACPHVFFVGNQPRFSTTVIEGPTGQNVRLIAVPKFKETGELVLLDSETLEIELLRFGVHDPTGDEMVE